MSTGDRLYRALLHAFPRDVRAEAGDVMAAEMRARRRAAAGRPVALAVIWVAAAHDALWHGLLHRAGIGPSLTTSSLKDSMKTCFDIVTSFFSVGALGEVRLASRRLIKAPGFTAVAVLTMALGVGATTAIFSLVNGVLLRPLSYAEPAQLVMVWQDYTARNGPIDEWASPGVMRDWRDRTDVFSSVSALGGWNASTAFDGSAPEALQGEQVTYDYFTTLGLAPAAGRWFEPREDMPDAPRAVVLSHGLWISRFGGDPLVIGRTLRIGDAPHEIVGVAPPDMRGVVVANAALWRPLRLNLATPTYNSIFLRVVGRLAPGVNRDGAQAALSAGIAARQEEEPMLRQTAVYVQPAQEWIVGDARLPLLVLMAAVLTLLALTVANIANLVLARASVREREFSVRAAIGASRGQLVRLMILESLALAVLGGIGGMVVGMWMLQGLLAIASDFLPRAVEVRLDGYALAFTALVAATAGLLFGLAPALQLSRPDLQGPLREGRGTTSRRGQLVRQGLVVAQIALALVILASASLIVRSFAGLQRADLGFSPDGVAVGTVALAGSGYRSADEVLSFLRQLDERLPSIPGASHAAFTTVLPLAAGDSDTDFGIVGKPERLEDGRRRVSWYRSVSPTYFETMRMRMAAGRGLTPQAPEAVVNEAFVRRFFPDEPALGAQLLVEGTPLTIVGVIADARTKGPRSTTPNEMYLPYQYMPEATYSLVVRMRDGTDASTAIPVMRTLVASIDPKVPLARPSTMTALVGDALAQPRLLAVLLGAFAGAALLLALLGIYGLIAYSVGQRTSEMGIRLALGATPGEIVRLVLRDGLRLGAVGVVIGVVGALAASGTFGALLYGVEPRDPVTFVGAVVIIALTALVGSWLPARRASRTAPTEALRG